MIEGPPSTPLASPETLEEWLKARLADEERGAIKRLSIPDLYDHFGGDWQKTLEAYRKLEALRAVRRIENDSADNEEERADDANA